MVITETTISLPVKCGRPVNQRFINLHGVIVFQLEERTFRKYFTLILNIFSSRNDYSIWPNCTVIIKRFNILLIIVNKFTKCYINCNCIGNNFGYEKKCLKLIYSSSYYQYSGLRTHCEHNFFLICSPEELKARS